MTAPRRHRTADRGMTGADPWDAIGGWIAKYGARPWLVVVTAAVAAIHWHVFFGEVTGDDLTFHFAESVRIADCLRHLDFDLWNPSANAGYASAYYYQVLPQLASAIPAALFGHNLFFFQLSVFLPLVCAPACAYRGVRLLGCTRWQAAMAAFVIAFMNGESRWGAGNAGTFQVGLYTQTWGLCVLPLALGHGARWISREQGLAAAIGWGAFAFLCHPFVGVSLGISLVIAFACKFAVTWRLWLPRYWSDATVQGVRKELHRLTLLGLALLLSSAPVLLPLVVDRDGFGGFPHRVSDEVGPGFRELQRWYATGALFDFAPANIGFRLPLITLSLPIVFPFTTHQRYAPMRWLWPPGIVFALWLGLGPHAGKVGDDLLPAVRALGAMQTVLGLGIGVGAIRLGQWFWNAPWDRWLSFVRRRQRPEFPTQANSSGLVYAVRTLVAAVAASVLVFIVHPGFRALSARVEVASDRSSTHRPELMAIIEALKQQPPGRKQAGPGAENHWWNLLPYAYGRVPALLQMGGAGLQSSPNYDFLWTNRDLAKSAWTYDAPYLVFQRTSSQRMPPGETILQTDHYELRKLRAPGLVSPMHVVGVLPAGYRTGELGHVMSLAWGKTSLGSADRVLAFAGWGGVGPAPQGRVIQARRQHSPGGTADIVAEVEAAGTTTFGVRESWHPRWRAFVDGIAMPVQRVTPDFPAVEVGPGKHTLEFRFDRPRWALLVWLAWPFLTIAAWLVFRPRGERSLRRR